MFVELVRRLTGYSRSYNFYSKKNIIIERMEIDFIFSRLINKKKLRILDIGAHHGEFLDIFSNLKFANIRQNFEIFCFEPFISNFNIIKKKTKYLGRNIKANIYNFAISNKTLKKFFYVGSSDTLVSCEGRWLKNFKKEFLSYKKILMQCISFKDFIKKYKFNIYNEIDLLKIDAEGHDFIVLNDIFRNNLIINSVMIEFDTKNFTMTKSIIKFLKLRKLTKIFIFGRNGVYTCYIGEYKNNYNLQKIINENNILCGNIVAFKN
jgi:FkbM family methyltransferase